MANETTTPVKSIKRKLGRGLGSLLSTPVQIDVPVPQPPGRDDAPLSVSSSNLTANPAGTDKASFAGEEPHGVRLLMLSQVHPNTKQPRQHFDEQALQMLATSIATSGLMQPIVVRSDRGRTGEGAKYEIIAGERRWRAAQRAGLERIPAVVRDVDDRTAAELSLVENLQREDLNPMERADAFRRLIDDFGLTHQEIAHQVGLDRSSVTNHLRLHELDEFSKDALRNVTLTIGHAKALLVITNISRREAIARQAIREGWSVRELERRVKMGQDEAVLQPSQRQPSSLAPAAANTADLEKRLSEHLGTKVRLHPGRTKGSGRLVIEFFTLDQFEGLLQRIQYEGD